MALRLKALENTLAAEDIALKYMAYLAGNPEKFEAFCSQSGLGLDDLKARLSDLAFQGFLLDILLQDESELLAFAAEHALRPESVMVARSKLPGFST
jgi:Protein of unknown function (DUF3572)